MPEGANASLSPHHHAFALALIPSPRYLEPSHGSEVVPRPASRGSVSTGPIGKLREGLMLPKGPILSEPRLRGHGSQSGLPPSR